MGTMNLSGIDEINALHLEKALGVEKKRGVVYDDLDDLAGTWSKKDAAEFERAVSVFEKVDEEMWK